MDLGYNFKTKRFVKDIEILHGQCGIIKVRDI